MQHTTITGRPSHYKLDKIYFIIIINIIIVIILSISFLAQFIAIVLRDQSVYFLPGVRGGFWDGSHGFQRGTTKHNGEL